MADLRSPETHTEEAERRGPVGHHAHSTAGAASSTTATVALILGVVGVVFALIPGWWFVAVPAGVVGLAVAEPIRRRGPQTDGHRWARIAVIAGIVAVLGGALNFAVTFGAFDFFTVEPDQVLD